MVSLITSLTLVAILATPAVAATYKGGRTDIYTGRRAGKWTITTRERGSTLAVTVKCKPKRRCGDFKRLTLNMLPESTTGYFGLFRVGGGLVRCDLEASVYSEGFEGVYNCEDGQQGSISGRRARRVAPSTGGFY